MECFSFLRNIQHLLYDGKTPYERRFGRALSWTSLLWLYLLFLVRLGGWETEKPEAWSEIILSAIPKKTDKVGLQSMRYISLLPVLQKFYIRALQTAVRRERKPHETNIIGI